MATKNLKTANDPQPLRYASGKPPVPASIEQRPSDDGTMPDGTTGGNFEPPAANNFGVPVKDASK
jgi:hypothetical protein